MWYVHLESGNQENGQTEGLNIFTDLFLFLFVSKALHRTYSRKRIKGSIVFRYQFVKGLWQMHSYFVIRSTVDIYRRIFIADINCTVTFLGGIRDYRNRPGRVNRNFEYRTLTGQIGNGQELFYGHYRCAILSLCSLS